MNSSKLVSNLAKIQDPTTLRKALSTEPYSAVIYVKDAVDNECDSIKVNELAKQLESLTSQKVALTDSHRRNSASIGKARKNGEDFQEYLKNSRSIGNKLKQNGVETESIINELVAMCIECSLLNCDEIADSGADVRNEMPVAGPGQFLPYSNPSSTEHHEALIAETCDEYRWNTYVTDCIHATHYHQYQWRGIIERNFTKNCWYFIAEMPNGEIVGVASSVHMNSRILGTFMLSMPFLIYGGPLCKDLKTSQRLAEHICSVAQKNNCTHTELRESHPREDWHPALEKVSMVLELPLSLSALNTSLGSKLRAQIKRASTENPVLELGGKELIPDFYTVFSRKMRDLGTPVYAMSFFLDIANTFPETTHIAVVRLNGKPVATAFLISFRNTLEVPWAASNKKYNRLSINMFMYHALLEYAVTQGYKYFDFGRSTRDGSTYKFKKQWGAEERQLYWHFFSNGKPYLPETNSAHTKFSLAIRIWKTLPLWASNRIGPLVAKQLPW